MLPHEAGLSIAKPFPPTSAPLPGQDACHILAGAVYLERGLFFPLHRQGDSLRLARSSLPSGDTCSLVIALHIATSARFQGVRHASQRVPLARNSRREVPSDVTRTLNLRGFPCWPARVHRPGNPLRTSRERLSRHEVPGDVTRTLNLHGFPCRQARAYRPGD